MVETTPTGQALPRMRRLADAMVWGGFNWQAGAAPFHFHFLVPAAAPPVSLVLQPLHTSTAVGVE